MLPYGRQCIDEDDVAAVAAALRGDFLTTGPVVEEFEKALCGVTQSRYAAACANGTTALHLAALALEIGPGDAVVVPSMTFLATANAVRYCDAEVIFADVDPETGLMGPQHLEEALERYTGQEKPKAVFPVHLTGQCVDLVTVSKTAKDHGLKVVADASHAIGGACHDYPVGACVYEDMATFSFHPVKTIAMGEGGAISTNNPDYLERMKRFRHHGIIKSPEDGPWCYEMPELGYNYRVTDIQCALGLSQLNKLEYFVARRRALVALYDDVLSSLAPVVLPPVRVAHSNPAWHIYAVRINFEQAGVSRADVMERLHGAGVGTQVHYIPVHQQPYYKNRYGEIALPGAQNYYENTLSLPLYPSMKDEDVTFVVEQLRKSIGGY